MKVRFVSEQACVKIGIQEEYQVTRVHNDRRDSPGFTPKNSANICTHS